MSSPRTRGPITTNAFSEAKDRPQAFCLNAGAAVRSVIAGLDPAIHLLSETLFEDGWMRGSSPRMTTEECAKALRLALGVEHRGAHGLARALAGPDHELERRIIAFA